MAIIQPYADPSAHGKVTPGLAFIRRGNKVSFGANRRPRNKNTAEQQTQRDKIRQAVANYRLLNFEELLFLQRRGSMKSQNKYNLFTSSQLKGNEWSKVNGHQLQQVNDIVLFDPKQDAPLNVKFDLECILSEIYPDNIELKNKLDSETGGIISSDYGPDFVWTGTPSHPPCRFNNGAFSNNIANYITTADNGAFFKPLFNKFIFACWMCTTYDVTNGEPTVGGRKPIMTYEADTPVGNTDKWEIFFFQGLGLAIQRTIDTVVTAFFLDDPAITFTAGDKVFLLVAYDQQGIEGGDDTLEVWFGDEDNITKVFSDDTISAISNKDEKQFILLNAFNFSRTFSGTIDNPYVTGEVSNSIISELTTGRNIENFNTNLGFTFDNENRFNPGGIVDLCPILRLKISNLTFVDWFVPFYWALGITWSNEEFTERTTVIRLPKITVIESTTVLLWLSQDMSCYFDENLYRLGATDNI